MLATLAGSMLPNILGRLTGRGITYGGAYFQSNGGHINMYQTNEPSFSWYEDEELEPFDEAYGSGLPLGPSSPFKSIPLIGALF